MKLTIPQPILADLLARGGAVAPKSGSTIMSNLRLVTRNDSLFVASTDGDRFSEACAPASIEAQGATTVNAVALAALISRYPKDGVVSFEVETPILLRVKCGRSRVGFGIMAVSSFPEWGAINAEASYPVSGPALAQAFARLKPLFGSPGRPSEGAFIEAEDGVLNIAAFNGNALAWARIECPAAGPVMGVPAGVCDAFARVFGSEETVTVHAGENRIGFEAGGMRLESKLIVNPANPYKLMTSVREMDRVISFGRADMLDAVDRAVLATEEGQYSALAVIPRDDGLELRARNSKGGEVLEGVDAECAADFTAFGVNPPYLRCILGGFTADRVTIEQAAGATRYLVYADNDETYRACFAPVWIDPALAA